jgi:hypothetical protein
MEPGSGVRLRKDPDSFQPLILRSSGAPCENYLILKIHLYKLIIYASNFSRLVSLIDSNSWY